MDLQKPTNDIGKIKIKVDIGDTIDYVSNIFKQAINMGASDIHIEPNEEFLLIRFRKDGDFLIGDKVDVENTSSIITRLKVLSRTKIDENKKPQDGKIIYYHEDFDEDIDIRFSTLPTKFGEKIVMRILRQNENLTNLDSLDFIDINLENIKKSIKKTYGIILIAGPTGSGKTTTLTSILKQFNPLEYNISTLEDPIEYNVDFVNQSQVKPEIGYTFATGLRSLVRQDPDIIMVGEIRDRETANLAIEAALTGHLVLSTIHTNSAAATIQRLNNMGMEPFLLASAIKLIISQRLGKKICPHCKQKDIVNDIKIEKVKKILSPILSKEELEKIEFYRGKGCEKCNGTGYMGRMGFHEVLFVGEYLEDSIINKESANSISKKGVENGMITIVQDALIKALMGKTTIDEAIKLI